MAIAKNFKGFNYIVELNVSWLTAALLKRTLDQSKADIELVGGQKNVVAQNAIDQPSNVWEHFARCSSFVKFQHHIENERLVDCLLCQVRDLFCKNVSKDIKTRKVDSFRLIACEVDC